MLKSERDQRECGMERDQRGVFMEEIKESMEERSENMFKKEKRVLNYVPAIPKRRLL